ncbi:MAG: aminotransferase class V-fold PLP-dependent enzyme [Candidatus Nanopelagicales bacterium]|jgi:cysteine desulfurase|nr:aminotransferase class V-fold PLP-dependent enzyme [Candidatus Nanopelagicales bacterium]
MSRYLDAASGTPLRPGARRALEAAIERGWADPSRLHRPGRVARQLLDAARASVAERLGALPQEVTFTGSHAEALHLAVLGLSRGRAGVGAGVVASAVEHSAVLRAADWVSGPDGPVLVPVDPQARLDLEAFATAVAAPGVALACVQQANGEVGTLQPVAAAHAAARAAGVPLVVDAGPALGHVAPAATWDVLAGAAHTWGGPAGVGVLAVRTGVRWRSPLPTDEAGRRAGTPDVPAIVAAATALEEATAELAASAAQQHALVAQLRRALPQLADDVVVLGPDEERLPHLVAATVLYADGEVLVGALDRAGFAVSSGSACTADTRRPSHVLAAMGAITHGNLRVSLPPGTTGDDTDALLAALPAAIAAARDAGLRAARP